MQGPFFDVDLHSISKQWLESRGAGTVAGNSRARIAAMTDRIYDRGSLRFKDEERRHQMISADGNCVEIRVKGKWVNVPAVDVNGKKLIATGNRLRIARIRSEEMMQEELKDPEVYIQGLKLYWNRVLRADVFTFTQKLPATRPMYSYPMEWDSVAAIHLANFEEWWESLPQETRKNVRRSQKRGVVVRPRELDDHLIKEIREVNDDAPLRQGTRNAYYGKSHEETKRLYGEFVGRCDFLCAYSCGELIGFLHLIYRGNVASILNLTTKPSQSDKRPANILLAKAVEICAANGVSYITYGLYNYGNKRENSLREFKIRNGFREIVVPRYFVPLTTWGRLCMKANLHRGVTGVLPHSVITVAVSTRAMWYRFFQWLSRRSSTSERPNSTRQMERSSPPAGSNF